MSRTKLRARALIESMIGKRRGPKRTGRLSVSGIHGRVEIVRDSNGVPCITADEDDDAWYGLGFCHAQDRGGQLEITARALRGTLSEVIGEEGVSIDRLARRVAFRRAAEGQYAVAREAVQRQLAAYSRGVNAGFREGRGRSIEHLLLGADATVWDKFDPQAMAVFLCFALASNWDIELVRYQILRHDGLDALLALDPLYPPELAVSVPPGAPFGGDACRDLGASEARYAVDIEELANDAKLLREVLGATNVGGSNAWAVAGSRSASGRPILAGDPHLAPMLPSSWYLASIGTPRWRVVGGSFVGLPGIACGHNGKIAWGATAAHCDNTDLFIEELSPDRSQARGPNGWEPCDVRREVIHVKGGPDVIEDIVTTSRGPLVTSAFSGVKGVGRLGLSLAATWLEPRRYTGFFGVHQVTNHDEFRACFGEASTASGAMIYADSDGHIGYDLTCEVPRRTQGLGALPQPAWEAAWRDGHVPWDEMPYTVDPDIGFVATANNAPIPAGTHPFLGIDHLDGYRMTRIAEALGERDDWTLAATATLQLDRLSLPWRELRPYVVELDLAGRAARAQAILARWDGRMEPNSAAASVYAYFVHGLIKRIVEEKAPKASSWAMGKGFNDLLPFNLLFTRRLSHAVRLVRSQPDGWFGETDWESVIDAALAGAIQSLSERFGDSAGLWLWGQIRPLRALHLFGQKAALAPVFNSRPIPVGGDSSTISAHSVDPFDPAANPVGSPTLRMQIDVGNWSESRWIVFPGQTGDPLEASYESWCDRWAANEGIGVAWTSEEIATARETGKTLLLDPA